MADSATISALRCLLPSLPASNKPFPPLLLSQCNSLLALSRQRASNLKSEEEIARAHACAELACIRLRAQLRLPAIKNGAGAPCKPKVYAKLLKFLDGVLEETVAAAATPRGRKRDGNGEIKEVSEGVGGSGRRSNATGTPKRRATEVENAMDLDDTPSKKRPTGKSEKLDFKGKVNSRKQGGEDLGADDKAPRFVMPSIRKLCKLFSTPEMAPHVYTGTCVILELSGIWLRETDLDDDLQNDILVLITALYLMVLTRMQEEEMTTEVYDEVTSKSIKTFKLGDDAAAKIEEWIGKLNEEGWCTEEDWWESVPESMFIFGKNGDGVGDGDGNTDEDVTSISKRRNPAEDARGRRIDIDEVDPEGVLLPGLGTMLHVGIDWSSIERNLDYEAWFADITKKLGSTPKAQGKRAKAVATT